MMLTAKELQELTGKMRHGAQVRALRAMGIEHRVRPDGSVAVLRSHVEGLLGGVTPSAKLESEEPDWNAIA